MYHVLCALLYGGNKEYIYIYKSDGTGCKIGENSGYVAADKLQSIGTSYCSSTQKNTIIIKI